MKFALAQLNFHIGNFEENAAKITHAILQAKEKKADVVLFPELAISGYPARDFLNFDHFISCCTQQIESIATSCKGITAIIGAPTFNTDKKGKKLRNSAFVLQNGKVSSVHHKMLLPNYDVFDEYRYFEPATEITPIHIHGETWAITICEDLWEYTENSLYPNHPLDQLKDKNLDGIINIASSPFSKKQRELRTNTLINAHNHFQKPIVYVNQIGAQTELVFDGGSAVVTKSGELLEGPYFKEELLFWDSNSKETPVGLAPKKGTSEIARIHDALILGVKDYFRKLGFKKAILGLSGGIDSAVTLAIAAKALGAENVVAVLMPSEFSSDHSVSDSLEMVKNLGCPHYELPIKSAYDALLTTLESPFSGTEFGLAEENLQARIRGVLLMAISNKQGQILLNTSNKSEIAVGFGTLYGDMCGGLSVIGDVYKEEVYALAAYINSISPMIPTHIITKPPSAELRPNQFDSDRLPDYEVLDAILNLYIEEEQDINAICKALPKVDDAIIKKTLRLVNINEYKRHQTPPILRVSTKAFGQGRRIPIVGKYLN